MRLGCHQCTTILGVEEDDPDLNGQSWPRQSWVVSLSSQCSIEAPNKDKWTVIIVLLTKRWKWYDFGLADAWIYDHMVINSDYNIFVATELFLGPYISIVVPPVTHILLWLLKASRISWASGGDISWCAEFDHRHYLLDSDFLAMFESRWQYGRTTRSSGIEVLSDDCEKVELKYILFNLYDLDWYHWCGT